MIYEYALEPELVASWTDRRDCRYYMTSFGYDHGRVVSRFPRHWKKLVWQAFGSTDDLARQRIEVLLACLSDRMVKRGYANWDPTSASWLENAEREHQRLPFHAILARTNPRSHPVVLTDADLEEDDDGRWAVKRDRFVVRNTEEMANAVAPLLQYSSQVLFIDPYFSPERLSHRRPLEAFLERLVRLGISDPPQRVEVYTAEKKEENFFRRECETKLPQCIPEGMRVRFRRLRQRADGEKFHNRYILTDLAGVFFGIGLDEGAEGETDDVMLMGRELYEKRWSQYSGDPPVGFDQDGEPFVVLGARKLEGKR